MKTEITETFPPSLKPDTVKKAIEGNIKQNSNYTCEVTFIGHEDGENVFSIESDNAYSFYLIGMTGSALIARIS